MKELININKLKEDLISELKNRSIRMSTVSTITQEKGYPKHIYMRAIGTGEMQKTVDEVFAKLDTDDTQPETIPQEAYTAELQQLTHDIQQLRCKVQRQMKDNDYKEDLVSDMYNIEAKLRQCSERLHILHQLGYVND